MFFKLSLSIFILCTSGISLAFSQSEGRQVTGYGYVSAWAGAFPESYVSVARMVGISDAELKCGGEVKQISNWHGQHIKNGGSDGEPTWHTYIVQAQFECLDL